MSAPGTALSACRCEEEVTFKPTLSGGVLQVKKEGEETQKTWFLMYEGMEPRSSLWPRGAGDSACVGLGFSTSSSSSLSRHCLPPKGCSG